jgi:hypothetical protein
LAVFVIFQMVKLGGYEDWAGDVSNRGDAFGERR